MIETPGWLRLPRPLLAALLSSDELATTCEVRLLQGAIAWALTNLSPSAAAAPAAGAPAADSLSASARQQVLSAASAISSLEAAQAYRAALEHTGAGSASVDLHSTLADALLPPLPPALLQQVRALLADVFPSLRLAQMPLHVLRSATVGALVPSDLTLPAVFHKLSLEQEHTNAALLGSYRPPTLAVNQGWAPTPASAAGSTAGFQLLNALTGEAPAPGQALAQPGGAAAGSAASDSAQAQAARAMAGMEFLLAKNAADGWSASGGSGSSSGNGSGAGALPGLSIQQQREAHRRELLQQHSPGLTASAAAYAAAFSTAAGSGDGGGGGGLLGPSLHSPFSSFFPPTLSARGAQPWGEPARPPQQAPQAPRGVQQQQQQYQHQHQQQPASVFYAPGAFYDRDTLAVLAGLQPTPPPATAAAAASALLDASSTHARSAYEAYLSAAMAAASALGGASRAKNSGAFARRFSDLRSDAHIAHALLLKGVLSTSASTYGASVLSRVLAGPVLLSPAVLPPTLLRFDLHPMHSASVALSNGGRSVCIVGGEPNFGHSSGVGAAGDAVSALAYAAAGEGPPTGGGSSSSGSGSSTGRTPLSLIKTPRLLGGGGASAAAASFLQPQPTAPDYAPASEPVEDMLLPILPLCSLPSPAAASALAAAASLRALSATAYVAGGSVARGGSSGGDAGGAGAAPAAGAGAAAPPPAPLMPLPSVSILPSGATLSLHLCLDDSSALTEYDPSSARVAAHAEAWESDASLLLSAAAAGVSGAGGLLQLPPLDYALCIVTGAVDIDSNMAMRNVYSGGVASLAPIEPVVLWMCTNSGHVLSRAGVPSASAAHAAGQSALGPMRHLGSGLAWGIGSVLTLSLDSGSGDVGITVANTRCGWEEGGGSSGSGSSGSSGSSAGNGSAGSAGNGSAGSRAGAPPRPGPPPFSLLPTTLLDELPLPPPAGAAGAGAAPLDPHAIPARFLHQPYPAYGAHARIHAAITRLPLEGIALTARSLQVALLARGKGGALFTVLPGPCGEAARALS